MANTSSAKKAIRVSESKTVKNLRHRRAYKEERKTTLELIASNKVDEAKAKIPAFYKAIDKAAKVGTMHKNTASRLKSRLAKKLSSTQESKSISK